MDLSIDFHKKDEFVPCTDLLDHLGMHTDSLDRFPPSEYVERKQVDRQELIPPEERLRKEVEAAMALENATKRASSMTLPLESLKFPFFYAYGMLNNPSSGQKGCDSKSRPFPSTERSNFPLFSMGKSIQSAAITGNKSERDESQESVEKENRRDPLKRNRVLKSERHAIDSEEMKAETYGPEKRSKVHVDDDVSDKVYADMIGERLSILQDLIPNVFSSDKVTVLDEAIDYILAAQQKLKIMSVRLGLNMVHSGGVGPIPLPGFHPPLGGGGMAFLGGGFPPPFAPPIHGLREGYSSVLAFSAEGFHDVPRIMAYHVDEEDVASRGTID